MTTEQLRDAVAARSARSTIPTDAVAAAGGWCGNWSYAAAPGAWSVAYNGGCGVFGSPGLRVSYNFIVTPDTNQMAAGQGMGFYEGYNGSTYGVWQAWYPLGTVAAGEIGSGTVPWGNILATPKFKAESVMPSGAFGYWGY